MLGIRISKFKTASRPLIGRGTFSPALIGATGMYDLERKSGVSPSSVIHLAVSIIQRVRLVSDRYCEMNSLMKYLGCNKLEPARGEKKRSVVKTEAVKRPS